MMEVSACKLADDLESDAAIAPAVVCSVVQFNQLLPPIDVTFGAAVLNADGWLLQVSCTSNEVE